MNHCGFCKSINSSFQYPTSDIFGNSYEIRLCKECNAYFLSPYPTKILLAQAYDETYYGEGDEKFNEGLIEKMLDFFRNRRAKRIATLIKGKGRILDIGCGNGRFLHQIQQFGNIEGFGIEMPGRSAERASKVLGEKLKIGVLERDDYPSGYFDAVTLFHVFEHLTDPIGYLEIISKILKTEGILYMSFPNIDSIQSKLFKGDWLHLDPPRHLFFFAPETFKDLMSQYGFEVIDEKHFNIEYNPFGFQQSLLNKIYAKREVLYESLKGNSEYTKAYSNWNLTLQNLFFKVTAPLFIVSDWFASIIGRGATVEFTMIKRSDKNK